MTFMTVSGSVARRQNLPEVVTGRRPPDPLALMVAGGLLVLLPLRLELANGVTVGLLAALALAPVWWKGVRAHRSGILWIVAVMTCLAAGLWLTAYASTDHAVAPHQIRMWVGLLVTLAVSIGVVLWARTLMPDGAVGALYGLGMLGSSLVNGFPASNAWKGGYSLPLTVLLLGLAWWWRRRSLEVGLALLLAVVSATNDSRSHFAMVLLAVALILWQSLVRGVVRSRRRSAVGSALSLAAIGLAVYALGQSLLLEGYLGEETQVRSQQQVEASGSILLGGRPEIGATLALMAHRPLGYGFGTLPNFSDISAAKAGMATLNYDPDNGYVENYMFGEIVKLHSIVGDSWALFGFVGLGLAGLVVWTMVRRVSVDLATGGLSALTAFLAARLLWDTAFGGLYAALPVLGLAIGLALLPHGARSHEHPRS